MEFTREEREAAEFGIGCDPDCEGRCRVCPADLHRKLWTALRAAEAQVEALTAERARLTASLDIAARENISLIEACHDMQGEKERRIAAEAERDRRTAEIAGIKDALQRAEDALEAAGWRNCHDCGLWWKSSVLGSAEPGPEVHARSCPRVKDRRPPIHIPLTPYEDPKE